MRVPPPAPHPWRRLFRSFIYAGRGLAYALRSQPNLRIHVVAAGLALLAAVWLRFTPEEVALVVLLSAAVIAAELLNTAIEAVVDLASPQVHPLAAAAKDAAAGAVLALALAAVLIGLLLYGPRLAQLLAG